MHAQEFINTYEEDGDGRISRKEFISKMTKLDSVSFCMIQRHSCSYSHVVLLFMSEDGSCGQEKASACFPLVPVIVSLSHCLRPSWMQTFPFLSKEFRFDGFESSWVLITALSNRNGYILDILFSFLWAQYSPPSCTNEDQSVSSLSIWRSMWKRPCRTIALWITDLNRVVHGFRLPIQEILMYACLSFESQPAIAAFLHFST